MPTADREGLREELAEAAFRHAHAYPEKVCWAEVLRIASAIPDGVVAVAVEAARANADALIAGPLLSALLAQADTAERMEAERDEARGNYEQALTRCNDVMDRVVRLNAEAAEAEDRVARLSVEVEALRAALDAAEACLSIVEPRTDRAEYMRTLDVVRTALTRTTGQPGPGAREGSSLPVEAAAQEKTDA